MSAAEPDEFDLLPDEYEGLQVDWHAILGPPAPQSSASPRSSQYSFDTVDDTFLAHVDELERQALSGDANTDGAWLAAPGRSFAS